MRWPSPRAQTAQPERWRMRRWSKEPRRMSVVEGRAAASLARVLSVRFIYIHETTKRWSCQEFFKHFYEILFFRSQGPLAAPPSPSGTERWTLAYRPSHVSQKNQKVSPRRKECQAPSISLRSLRLGEIRFFPSEGSTPSPRIRAYCLESPESLPSENFLFSFQSGSSAR